MTGKQCLENNVLLFDFFFQFDGWFYLFWMGYLDHRQLILPRFPVMQELVTGVWALLGSSVNLQSQKNIQSSCFLGIGVATWNSSCKSISCFLGRGVANNWNSSCKSISCFLGIGVATWNSSCKSIFFISSYVIIGFHDLSHHVCDSVLCGTLLRSMFYSMPTLRDLRFLW